MDMEGAASIEGSSVAAPKGEKGFSEDDWPALMAVVKDSKTLSCCEGAFYQVVWGDEAG